MAFFLFLVLSLFFHGTLGELACEELPIDVCSFSISSSGKRCSLETYMARGRKTVEYECKTSEVFAENLHEYVESDECIEACGVDRQFVGISSDLLLDPQSTRKLCSEACYNNCPNIVDLYFSMALGEGVYLPELCEKQRKNPHQLINGVRSSGAASGLASNAAFAPIPEDHSEFSAPAPAPIVI